MEESRLKKLRLQAGLSQEEAAFRIGVATQTLSNWEKMRNCCRDLKQLRLLLDEYGASTTDRIYVIWEMYGCDSAVENKNILIFKKKEEKK